MAAQQTMEGRREGQWQHSGPCRAGGTRHGSTHGQWRAKGRGQGPEQQADHAGQVGGAVESQHTIEGRREGIKGWTMEGRVRR